MTKNSSSLTSISHNIIRLVLALIAGIALTLVISGQALADSNGEDGHGEGGDGGSIGTGSGSGTDPGDTTDPDGEWNVPTEPPAPYWIDFYIRTSSPAPCAATNDAGDPVIGKGEGWQRLSNVSASYARDLAYANTPTSSVRKQGDGGGTFGSSALTCLYAKNYSDSSLNVVVGSSGEITKVAPNTKTITTGSVKTRWGKGEETVESAKASQSAQIELNAYVTELGRYYAEARTEIVTVRIRTYHVDEFGNTPAPRILSVGGSRFVNYNNSRGELLCSGWVNGYTGNTNWTAGPCEGSTSTGGVYQCRAADSSPAVSINGVSGASATSFRDGSPNRISFGLREPQGSGVSILNGGTTRFTHAGSPWLENTNSTSPSKALVYYGYSANDKTQRLTDVNGTAWVGGGVQDSVWVRGYWASTEGDPTKVSASWNYPIRYTVESVRITGINDDGTWETTTSRQSVDTSAICSSSTASLNFVRVTAGSANIPQ